MRVEFLLRNQRDRGLRGSRSAARDTKDENPDFFRIKETRTGQKRMNRKTFMRGAGGTDE